MATQWNLPCHNEIFHDFFWKGAVCVFKGFCHIRDIPSKGYMSLSQSCVCQFQGELPKCGFKIWGFYVLSFYAAFSFVLSCSAAKVSGEYIYQSFLSNRFSENKLQKLELEYLVGGSSMVLILNLEATPKSAGCINPQHYHFSERVRICPTTPIPEGIKQLKISGKYSTTKETLRSCWFRFLSLPPNAFDTGMKRRQTSTETQGCTGMKRLLIRWRCCECRVLKGAGSQSGVSVCQHNLVGLQWQGLL